MESALLFIYRVLRTVCATQRVTCLFQLLVQWR